MKESLNATHFEAIPTFPDKAARANNIVHAIIETPKGSSQKYALNNVLGIIAYHDVLPDNLQWPFDYGFVPRTLAKDGDPLDILIINANGFFSGCLLPVRVIGVVRERKDKIENDRLLAVPLPSPGAPKPTDAYSDISDIPQATLDQVLSFLANYSRQQGHDIEQRGIAKAARAMKLVRKTRRAFNRNR